MMKKRSSHKEIREKKLLDAAIMYTVIVFEAKVY